MNDADLKSLWQEAPSESAPSIDLEALQTKAAAFERKVFRRNLLEWVAAVFVFGFFGADALTADSVGVALGNGMIALAAVGLSLYLWRYGRIEHGLDPGLDGCAYVEAQAQILERQAVLLARTPIWYLGPLAAGMIVLIGARMPGGGRALWIWALAAAFVTLVFAGVAWFNLRGARKLRAEAAALRAENGIAGEGGGA